MCTRQLCSEGVTGVVLHFSQCCGNRRLMLSRAAPSCRGTDGSSELRWDQAVGAEEPRWVWGLRHCGKWTNVLYAEKPHPVL